MSSTGVQIVKDREEVCIRDWVYGFSFAARDTLGTSVDLDKVRTFVVPELVSQCRDIEFIRYCKVPEAPVENFFSASPMTSTATAGSVSAGAPKFERSDIKTSN